MTTTSRMPTCSFATVTFRCTKRAGAWISAKFVTRPLRRRHVQSILTNLQLVATTATFLAAVQAQTISYSLSQNSTPIQIVTNIFGFVGLLFDVIGATSSLLYSILIQNSLQLVDDYLEDVKHLSSNELRQRFNEQSLTAFVSCGDGRRDLMWETVRGLSEHLAKATIGNRDSMIDPAGLPSLPTLQKLTRHIEILCLAGEGASLVMFFGALFLLISVLCLASVTQPPIIWITALASCIVFIALHSWVTFLAMFSAFRDEVVEETLIRNLTEIYRSPRGDP